MEEYKEKNERIFSVSDYIKILNEGLKGFKGKIIGEVSEVNFGPTGHVYFSLKDEKDGSVMKCIAWKYQYGLYGIKLEVGVKIIASGHPQVYPQRGTLSFIADVIEYSGEGILKKEYEKLKKKLEEEGIFEDERKRKIPLYLQKIGVITSLRSGAVIADFSNNLKKHGFKVEMIDSRVEGQEAIKDLLSSVKTFKKKDIEILIVMRGGGSLESMLAFNNELLVREIVNFPVPVIVAIGHHKDVPLLALSADLSVSTPSIAAVTLNESWEEALFLLDKHKRNIISSYENMLSNVNSLINQSIDIIRQIKDLIFDKYKVIETALKISFQEFKNVIRNGKINLIDSWNKSIFGFKSLLLTTNKQLEYYNKIIYLNNPETQFKLGYCMVKNNDKVIRSVKHVKINDNLDIRVVDGIIISNVKTINKKNE